MSKKIEVLLTLQDKLSKNIDVARGKIAQFGHSIKNVTQQFFNLRHAVAAFVAFKIGQSFIMAAAKIELFGRQLRAVTQSAAEASKKLGAIREFARISPLETEDVVKSYVRLRAVGIDPTIQQLRTLGGVAVLFNREMADILDGLIGLNKRTLRKLGIEIDRTGSQAIIASGNIKKVVEKDSASIRKALLEVWGERFPNAIEKGADTFVAQMAILRSNIFEFQAQLTGVFLPTIKKIVKSMSDFVAANVTNIKTYLTVLMGIVAVVRTLWNSATIIMRSLMSGIIQIIMTIIWMGKATDKVIEGMINSFKALGRVLERMIKERRFDIGTLVKEEFSKVSFQAVMDEVKGGLEGIARLQEITSKQTVKDINDIKNAWKDVGSEIETVKIGGLGGTGITGAEGGVGAGGKPEKEDESPFAKHYDLIKKWQEKFLEESKKYEQGKQEILKEYRNMNKTQEQIAYEEEIALLEQKKIQYPQLEEEIQALITAKHKEASDRRKRISEQEVMVQIDAYAKLGSAVNQLASQIVANSRASAKKKQNILIALAVAEGAASAVTAAKAGWDTGITYYDKAALAAAGVIEALAITAAQIATIKSQKFARGTSYAPGGWGIVGEEGPEAMYIPRGSQIMTNTQTKNTFGGTNVSFSINIAGDASDRTVEKIGNTLSQFGNDFANAVRTGHIDLKRLGIVTI
uniref:Putative tail tape measure protein n=1 Tax=viral metagenome TaxID=1070528 RepID=A0A6M3M4X9_9ZZZZ